LSPSSPVFICFISVALTLPTQQPGRTVELEAEAGGSGGASADVVVLKRQDLLAHLEAIEKGDLYAKDAFDRLLELGVPS